MTPREFLAVAVMVSTNADEKFLAGAEMEMERATTPESRAYWTAYRDEDAQRVGQRRVVWLEAQPWCAGCWGFP